MPIQESFKKIIQSNMGCAVIMAGSGSDDDVKDGKPSHIGKIANSLEMFGVPYEVRICSAHKQPENLMEMIDEYNGIKGSVTYVAVAGGTDALSGTLSFHALGPVISCPPDAPNQSCLTNPPGSSNAYVGDPKNVGRLVAQIYAGVNSGFRDKLIKSSDAKIGSLVNADTVIQEKYRLIQVGGD